MSKDALVKKVLFLCTGNSCRSQIAEAVVTAQLGNRWRAFSAGTDPAGYVHSKAIEVLAEIGIQHQGLSQHVDDFRQMDVDLVVTVCDSAAESCPAWLGKGDVIHQSFADPALARGLEDEILAAFRQVRDQITVKIPALLERHRYKAT
ncbi:MAG: arsenate reductase ArsC [Chloroflexi bacterium]|nr:arsenate reductase ArsC [Chloroflexota bacterium]